jgi:hypothetical protein
MALNVDDAACPMPWMVLRDEGCQAHSLGEVAPAGRAKVRPVPWKQGRRAMNGHIFGPVLLEEGFNNERYGMSA